MDLTQKGEHIFNELAWRSFLQDVHVKFFYHPHYYQAIGCIMHDLMHDLAKDILVECTNAMELIQNNVLIEDVHHMQISSYVMETSDHWPCVIQVKTSIPKGRIFRFENCWMVHDNFLPLVASCWNGPFAEQDAAKLLIAKFKALRNALRNWQSQLSNLKITIGNVKLVISFLDSIEEWRDL